MKWTFLKDVQAFLYYIATEPWRHTWQELKSIAKDTTRDLTNYRSLAEFFLALGLILLAFKHFTDAWFFLGAGLIVYLYYEWRRKAYRHRWKQKIGEE